MSEAAEGVNIPEAEVPEDVNEAVETGSPEASEQEEAAKQEEAKKAERQSWEQRRINEITRQKYEARAEAQRLAQEKEQLAQQLAEYQRALSGEEAQPQEQKAIDPDQIYKLAEQIAEQKQQQAKFVEKRDGIVSAGQKEFGEAFDRATDALFMAGAIVDDSGNMTSLADMLINDVAESHKVIMYLGENPAEAERIAKLPERQQARAIWEIESKLSTQKPQEPPKVSKAPEPVRPIGSRTAKVVSPEDMTMEEYVKYRNEQERKR